MNVDFAVLRVNEPDALTACGKKIAHLPFHFVEGVAGQEHFNRKVRSALGQFLERQLSPRPDKSHVRKADRIAEKVERLLGNNRAKPAGLDERRLG